MVLLLFTLRSGVACDVANLIVARACGRANEEKPMKLIAVVLGLGLSSAMGVAQGVNCNMQAYKAVDGLRAVATAGGVTLNWTGKVVGDAS